MRLFDRLYGQKLYGVLYGAPATVAPVVGTGNGALYGQFFGRMYGRLYGNSIVVTTPPGIVDLTGPLRARSALTPLSAAHYVWDDGTRARSA